MFHASASGDARTFFQALQQASAKLAAPLDIATITGVTVVVVTTAALAPMTPSSSKGQNTTLTSQAEPANNSNKNR